MTSGETAAGPSDPVFADWLRRVNEQVAQLEQLVPNRVREHRLPLTIPGLENVFLETTENREPGRPRGIALRQRPPQEPDPGDADFPGADLIDLVFCWLQPGDCHLILPAGLTDERRKALYAIHTILSDKERPTLLQTIAGFMNQALAQNPEGGYVDLDEADFELHWGSAETLMRVESAPTTNFFSLQEEIEGSDGYVQSRRGDEPVDIPEADTPERHLLISVDERFRYQRSVVDGQVVANNYIQLPTEADRLLTAEEILGMPHAIWWVGVGEPATGAEVPLGGVDDDGRPQGDYMANCLDPNGDPVTLYGSFNEVRTQLLHLYRDELYPPNRPIAVSEVTVPALERVYEALGHLIAKLGRQT